jgi:hypothetical protein
LAENLYVMESCAEVDVDRSCVGFRVTSWPHRY